MYEKCNCMLLFFFKYTLTFFIEVVTGIKISNMINILKFAFFWVNLCINF